MLNSIKCPKCSHKSVTRIGILLRMTSVYQMKGERFTTAYYNTKKQWPSLKELVDNKDMLGFYCKTCGHPFSEEENKEILKYCSQKKILQKLKFG